MTTVVVETGHFKNRFSTVSMASCTCTDDSLIYVVITFSFTTAATFFLLHLLSHGFYD